MLKSRVLILLPILAACTTGLNVPKSKVQASLQATLSQSPGAQANILVSFRSKTNKVLHQLRLNNAFESRVQKLMSLKNKLQANAAESQKSLVRLLGKSLESPAFKSLWISNQVSIKNADADLIQSLADLEEVAEIHEDGIIRLDKPIKSEPKSHKAKAATSEWGIELIGAPGLWPQINGTGIIVCGIDTGVRGSHEALKDNFLGTHGWSDSLSGSSEPYDDNGHGTHTVGSIVGQGGIGVSPGATWMACKACNAEGECAFSNLIDCGQWAICPGGDCPSTPQIISNSWGGDVGGQTWFDDVISAWHAAGIIPVFSIGNAGPDCGSAGSPGDSRDVIGVGATDAADGLARFSSVGPALYGSSPKPDLVAPGNEVRSAYHEHDRHYVTISGTSMACPHVSGVIALMLGLNPDLSYEQVRELLFAGSLQDVVPATGQNCGGLDEGNSPNNAVGHGRLDAVRTINELRDFKGSAAGVGSGVIIVLGGLLCSLSTFG